MSYTTEHQRMKPVLDLARRLDIATNSDPEAIFDAGNGGFQVWCTPQDHPKGWNGITMHPGSFSKPCEFVGGVIWSWEDERIVALQIESSAYALAEQKPDEYCNLLNIPEGSKHHTIFNRADDIEWLKEKIAWLFAEAGVPLLPFEHEPGVSCTPQSSYLLVYYFTDEDQYLVIVAAGSDPAKFCKPGYQIVQRLEIQDASGFPVDVVFHQEQEFVRTDSEPDEGPLLEQYENASRLGDDSWLESNFEDRVSGWQE